MRVFTDELHKFTFYFIENMTDKDLFDSDYDGISQIHEHSYIVVSTCNILFN